LRDSRLILAIFILSGAAGLMYEVVWSRQLVLVFGNTTQAVSTILTGFFGGLAVGSFVGGRIADRVRNPLRLYGAIELVLVGVVLLTPVTFRLLHEVYRGVFPSIEGQPIVLALIRFALAILALAPATVLMGATLPTLTRSLTSDGHLSLAFGRLYSANTVGAIVGTIAAGFVLIELFGLTETLVVGAACSGTAGIVALKVSRSRHSSAAATATPSMNRPELDRPIARPRVALLIAFVSGLTSLGYQVLWTRLLSSGTGNSTYVFTVILAIFLGGIALGATAYSTLRHRMREPLAFIAVAEILAAGIALAGLVLVISHPLVPTPDRPVSAALIVIVPVLLVVFPAATVLGFVLPAASTLVGDSTSTVAGRAGRLLAMNTLGSITATFAIPFFVVPALGSPASVLLLAVVNLAAGVWLLLVAIRPGSWERGRRVALAMAAVVSVALVLSLLRPGTVVDPSVSRIVGVGATLFDSKEDEIASVQAGDAGTPQLWVSGTAMTVLTVDTKLMPIIPLIVRPNSESALTVAFGMGSAFRSSLIAGLRTKVVELVPSVPTMFGFFYPDAATVLANPSGTVIITDGRNHLELTNDRYDVIVTDPPPPAFSSGVSVISSLEYYQAGLAHLNPDGVMMQWLPFSSPLEEVKAHLRTFRSVFPYMTVVFGPSSNGLYMVGSEAPVAIDDANTKAILSRPGVLDDVSSAFDSPDKTLDTWVARIRSLRWISDGAVDRFVGPGPLITDDHPLPEYFLIRSILHPDDPVPYPDDLRRLTAP
jgi:spermidine synthase